MTHYSYFEKTPATIPFGIVLCPLTLRATDFNDFHIPLQITQHANKTSQAKLFSSFSRTTGALSGGGALVIRILRIH